MQLQACWFHCSDKEVSCPHPELEMENEINFFGFLPEIKAMRRRSAISKSWHSILCYLPYTVVMGTACLLGRAQGKGT